jgi:aspartate/methionine/tyrosine aminotransferase
MPAFRTDPTFISTGSLSKVYGLSHLECGWIMAGRKTVERITPWFVLAEGNGSRYLESLSAVVFAHLDEHLARSRAIVIQNRKILCQALEPLIDSGLLQGNVPEHGCIYFTTVAGCRDTAALAARLAQKYNIYIVSGAFFGQASGMRIGFGGEPGRTADSINKLAEALSKSAGDGKYKS